MHMSKHITFHTDVHRCYMYGHTCIDMVVIVFNLEAGDIVYRSHTNSIRFILRPEGSTAAPRMSGSSRGPERAQPNKLGTMKSTAQAGHGGHVDTHITAFDGGHVACRMFRAFDGGQRIRGTDPLSVSPSSSFFF